MPGHPVVVSALRDHLAAHVDDSAEALVFAAPSGRPIWRSNLNKLLNWKAAVEKLGKAGLHFHDLRHTGNTLAAQTGASTRDLMARMGHDSSQAALIYQHATTEADRAIAKALDAAVQADRKRTKKAAKEATRRTDAKKAARRDGDADDGPAGALVPVG
jgi:integrase